MHRIGNVKDHLGQEFKTIREMYLHYGLNESVYYQRKRIGMSLEDILSTPIRKQKNNCVDDTLIYKRHHIPDEFKKRYQKAINV